MHLNDILENTSIKEMSLKTMISEENLEYLVEMNLGAIKKVKTLGFISIIEREYSVDLLAMRDEAIVFYLKNREGRNFYVNKPIETEERRGKSKLFLLILLGGLMYASWYFFTQFDKKHLHELIPFITEDTFEKFLNDKNTSKLDNSISALSIASIEQEHKSDAKEEKIKVPKEEKVQSEADVEVSALENKTIEKVEINTSKDTLKEDANISIELDTKNMPIITSKDIVSIIPSTRLWFGIIDMQTKQRDHFSIAQAYSLDVSSKVWLVATSSASFSLKQGEKNQEFSDTKEHYFKISKDEIEELTKKAYVEEGGWSQW